MDIASLFQQEVSASDDRGSWTGDVAGEEVTLYAKPLCPKDHEYVRKKGYPDFMTNMPIGAMVHIIAFKAETEDGKKVFKPNAHVPILMRMGQDKIGDIFGELFRDQLDEEDEAKFEERVGNSE